MATFGGVNIFGAAVTMNTADNPREGQLNAFFGISGLESLDGGSRGRQTFVKGLLYGNATSALASSEALFRSYHDGISRVLIDTLGVAWANVRLEQFQPSGRVMQSPGGYFFRPYRARFFHLE